MISSQPAVSRLLWRQPRFFRRPYSIHRLPCQGTVEQLQEDIECIRCIHLAVDPEYLEHLECLRQRECLGFPKSLDHRQFQNYFDFHKASKPLEGDGR